MHLEANDDTIHGAATDHTASQHDVVNPTPNLLHESSPPASEERQMLNQQDMIWPAPTNDGIENPYLYGHETAGLQVVPDTSPQQAFNPSTSDDTEKPQEEGPWRTKHVCGVPKRTLVILVFLFICLGVIGGTLGPLLSRRNPSSPLTNTSSPGPTTPKAPPSEPRNQQPFARDYWYHIVMNESSKPFVIEANINKDPQYDVAGMHIATELPSKNDTQYWQFRPIPSSHNSAQKYLRSLGNNIGYLYWIANKYHGSHYRLTTNSSESQDPGDLKPFVNQDRNVTTTSTAPMIRMANDLNPAQWWWVSSRGNDEWWIINAWTHEAWDERWWVLSVHEDVLEEQGNTSGYFPFMSPTRGRLLSNWTVSPISKITEDGWRT